VGENPSTTTEQKSLDPTFTDLDKDLEIDKINFTKQLDRCSLETIVELKISRFLEQIGNYYPDDFHSLIIKKIEKPLINQILKRTGNNQVHAAKILGINRNTLRKKIKMYGIS
jgi:DNA-binding protein Fis